jgi:hypothetical protein
MPRTRLDGDGEERFWSGVQAAERFFMGEGEVQNALEKLASGMTAGDRLKDLADAQELADSLNPFVRQKYIELWDAVHRRSSEM